MGLKRSASAVAIPTHRPEIDGLRALAVLAVVAYHACAPAAAHTGQTPFQAIGARGVDLFFVLSGFCLSLPYGPGSMTTAADAARFFRRRLTRIAPAYYVALASFALLALTPFGLPGIAAPVSTAFALQDLGRDALFFPTMTPIHDEPIWTLGIEMRWYVLFPVILVLFQRFKPGFALLAIACAFVAVKVGSPDCSALPAFMLGIVSAELTKRNYRMNALWPAAAAILFGFAVNEQLHSLKIDHSSVWWTLGCFALVTAVATNPFLRRCFAFRPLVAVGVASYSIYLVHEPVMNALAWAGAPNWFAGFASIAAGAAFYAAVERPLGTRRARAAMDDAILRGFHALGVRHSTPAPSRARV